jgi:hypothetical protein
MYQLPAGPWRRATQRRSAGGARAAVAPTLDLRLIAIVMARTEARSHPKAVVTRDTDLAERRADTQACRTTLMPVLSTAAALERRSTDGWLSYDGPGRRDEDSSGWTRAGYQSDRPEARSRRESRERTAWINCPA